MKFWKKVTSAFSFLRLLGPLPQKREENEFLVLFIAEMARVEKRK